MRVLPLLQEVRGWEENSDYPLPLKDSGSQALPQVPPTAPMLQLPFHPPSHEAPLRAVSSVRATPPASR